MRSNIQSFLKELKEEPVITRKMLERIPSDKQDWRPHEKSMPIKQLAAHLAELPDWISLAFTTEELDFGRKPYELPSWEDNSALLAILEKSVAGAQKNLENGKDEDLLPNWILRNGDQVLMTITKGELIRHALSQTIHHRAQLGVYLRLLNVPLPATYGPSADEPSF